MSDYFNKTPSTTWKRKTIFWEACRCVNIDIASMLDIKAIEMIALPVDNIHKNEDWMWIFIKTGFISPNYWDQLYWTNSSKHFGTTRPLPLVRRLPCPLASYTPISFWICHGVTFIVKADFRIKLSALTTMQTVSTEPGFQSFVHNFSDFLPGFPGIYYTP